MKWLIIVPLVLVAVWTGFIPLFIYQDRKAFNDGICKCGGHLHHFDDDSQGGQGWICEKCGRVVWLDWIRR